MWKKLWPMLFLLVVMVMGILSFSYSAPASRIYDFTQNLDSAIIMARHHSPEHLEDTLKGLQTTAARLIDIGQTHDGSADLDPYFEPFRTYRDQLSHYVTHTVMAKNQALSNLDFANMHRAAGRISPHARDWGKAMLTHQDTRVAALNTLNTLLEEMSSQLLTFETHYFESGPDLSIPYFRNLTDLFDQIQDYHSQYAAATSLYSLVKTEYYLLLRNMTHLEYFFGF